ncbi:MAG: (Fe-S)-binding protein, partial [Acidiferrobacteraceae bacterium]|nr:(Fe-S)-binding protein [Acidiferrobacteraceae bacterium]
MLKIEFETPPLGELLVTPPVQPDAMAHSRPFVAKPEHQQGLGFPGELVDNWQDVA